MSAQAESVRGLAASLFLVQVHCAPKWIPALTSPNRFDRRDRQGHDRGALHVAMGQLPAGVEHSAVSTSVSAPHPGAPGELVNVATTDAYFRALAAASPRVRMFTIGRSEEGRDIVMLAIADERGIADLDQIRAATAALADPRR